MPKNTIDHEIIRIVKEGKPENVKQLIKLVKEKFPLSEQEILNHILHLQEEEKIQLKPHRTRTPGKLTAYLRSNQANWYWITITLTLTTALLVFTIPENAYPLVYARYILGSLFVLWLPGYTFIKALFPEKELDSIERVALSIGMSLALVPIIGLLLNYTPWGIRLTPHHHKLVSIDINIRHRSNRKRTPNSNKKR